MSEHKRKQKRTPKLWFRAKTYGWGWFPVSWQGWAITALYAAAFALSLLIFFGWLGSATEANADNCELTFGILEFLAVLAILSYTLFRICSRFGEKPRWRWGKDT